MKSFILKLLVVVVVVVSVSTTNAFHQPYQLNTAHRFLSSKKATTDDKSSSSSSSPRYEETFINDNEYYQEPNKPASAFILGTRNFLKQSRGIVEQFLAEKWGITPKNYIPPEERPPICLQVTLSNEDVKEAERRREEREGGKVEVNAAARVLYDVGCYALDELFDGRPIARFWFLETIARIPYFSYVSMLHLYESFGWWRGVELRKVHNAEEYNELHHLLIMEALGGNLIWSDRFLGYHIAIGYYWALNSLFFFSPAGAYEFMELLESHAVDTYSTFLKENKTRLKSLPAPRVAKSYYKSADLYMFDDFQVSKKTGTRRPPCDTLYDVFKNINEDEAEHVKTMIACQDYARLGKLVVSPHLSQSEEESDPDLESKRGQWKEWANSINEMSPYESLEGVNELE